MNHRPCKCGSDNIRSMKSGLDGLQIACWDCGRRGPKVEPLSISEPLEKCVDRAWAAWDAEREAVAKAREALSAIGPRDNADEVRRMASEALALLGEEE